MKLFYSGNIGDHHLPEQHYGLPVMLSFWEIDTGDKALKKVKRLEARTRRRFHVRVGKVRSPKRARKP